TVQHTPLAFPNRFPDAFADALEVFKRDPTPGAFRRLHDGLADTVVDIAVEPLLTVPALADQALRTLGAPLLEFATQAREAGAHLIDLTRSGAGGMIQELAVGRGRQRHHAQVDTKVLAGLLRRGFRCVYCDRQEAGVAALAVEKIALPASTLQSTFG